MHEHGRAPVPDTEQRSGPVDRPAYADRYALANRLAEVSRDLWGLDSAQDTAHRIAELAVAVVPGCDAAGISVRHRSSLRTVAATDYAVRLADRLREELGEGPGHGPSDSADDAWPRWATAARAVGIGAAMGVPLRSVEDHALGTLALYRTEPGTFSEHARQVAVLFADHAAVALAGVRLRTNLERALRTSRTIGQAVGILMSRHALSETAAFDLLSTTSQRTNTKVRDLADTVVETGEIPLRLVVDERPEPPERATRRPRLVPETGD